jgi:hypothetical protein
MAGSGGWGWAELNLAGDGAPRVISVLEPTGGLGDIMVDGVPPKGVRPLSVLGSSSAPRTPAASDVGELVAQIMGVVGGPSLVGSAQFTGSRALSPSSRRVW